MATDRPFHSMPELGNCDRCNLKSLIGARSRPPLEVKSTLLTPNDDVGVENYRHLLSGALRVLRAFRRSRRQALASPFGKSILAKASAKSRPTQTFSLSGREVPRSSKAQTSRFGSVLC